MLRSLPVLLLMLVVAVCARPAAAHPSHVTIAEAEWNPKSKSLEVAMRVNAIDLEKVLRKRSKSPLRLDAGNEAAEKAVWGYLNDALRVYGADKKRLKAKWVGMEMAIHHGWLYFEFPCEHPPESLTFENRVFFGLEKDQVNTVIFKRGRVRQTLHFTAQKSRRSIALGRLQVDSDAPLAKREKPASATKP